MISGPRGIAASALALLGPILLGAVGAAPSSRQTVTLEPIEDAYVDQQRPASSFDDAPAWPVEIDTQSRERYPLLRFDTSGIHPDSQVQSALLRLWLEQSLPNHGLVLRGEAAGAFERLFASTGSRGPRP